MDITIGNKDLNGIDYLNGRASISAKQLPVYSSGLKGALARYNGSFSQYEEILYINSVRRQIYEYQTERFNYKNLPEGLDKYRFEDKVLENGSALLVKYMDRFYMFNYSMIDYNAYNEPIKVQITEPKSSLNGKIINLQSSSIATIIRNNFMKRALFVDAQRFITDMEMILYQIEKNVRTSAPKGILNLKNMEFEENGENPEKDSFETMINGQDTFYVLKTKPKNDQEFDADNEDSLFIPMELTDRTDSLLKNYEFMKEQLKELIGSEMNDTDDKKERKNLKEINNHGLSNSSRQHAFNIRKIDIEKANKLFDINIAIEYQSDEREDVEEEEDTEEVENE